MSQSSSQSTSGPVVFGDYTNTDSNPWLMPALVVGLLALLGLGYFLTKKGK